MSLAASATEVRKNFSEYMENARNEDVVIQRNGRPYVAMISIEELETLRQRKQDALQELENEFEQLAEHYSNNSSNLDGAWDMLQAAEPQVLAKAYKAGVDKRGY
jgi:prevent-host-death family protein